MSKQIDPTPLESFYQLLNQEPDKKMIRKNNQAGGALYLPISYLEMTLDEIYMGLWKMEDGQMQVVANEFVVTVQVSVFHPILKEWITRTGIGAVPIQQRRDSSITDMDAKIKNALQKNAPAAKALAFKNACKTLGKVFGRDLNRKDEDSGTYEPVTTQVLKIEAEKDKIFALAEGAKDMAILNGIFQQYRNIPGLPEKIMARRKELEAA